ncbi:hypothetical protein CRD60_03350 [Bifidobacterium aemilianum]|uniref:Uncharacterized protein n=1 Tax=Bifidobacterium aemilianum TaxID=2493120 RepID=A0A366K941_9BIFI|nr:hypothetical protein [Bifidobacterium aemilianum]RBP98189.1 hypothetical protein CRD60_03350 [Bifidobacterium aemilianum]
MGGGRRLYDSVVGSSINMVHRLPVGGTIVMAHHWSVSMERRMSMEESLKAWHPRCVVVVSSLELGIDMGWLTW